MHVGVTNRREFLKTVTAAGVVSTIVRQGAPANEWGSPVLDLHFHLRPQPATNVAHLDGAGVTKANLLTRGAVVDQVKALQAAAPAGSLVQQLRRDETGRRTGAHAGRQGWRTGVRRDEVPRWRRRSGAPSHVCARGRPSRADSDSLPGSRSLSKRRDLEHGVCADVRVDPQGVSQDNVHRACGCILGERERGLSQRSGLSDRPNQARRGNRQMARRLSQPVWRSVGQLRQ
jgi:hypothetical protein